MPRYSSSLLNAIDRCVNRVAYQRRYIGEYVNLWRKRKLIRAVQITPEQENNIQSLWKSNYGKTIPLYWHRLYASYTGLVDVNYFPEIFYSTILERKFNDPYLALSAENKSQLDLLLRLPGCTSSEVVPLVLFRSDGVYYNSSREAMSETQAIDYLYSYGRCVIKPSMDTDSGRNVCVLDIVEGRDKKRDLTIKDLFDSFDGDFLVQPYVEVHDALKLLNPTSVNTIRIITYLLKGKVYHSPLSMRIGAYGSEVDNIHAGGMVVGVSDDGKLNEMAFTEYGEKLYTHPNSGVVFKDIIIPGVGTGIKLVEKSHLLFPRLMFISWDVTIRKDGTPVIIEMNTRNQSAWFPQMVNGKSLFGDNTVSIINLLKTK